MLNADELAGMRSTVAAALPDTVVITRTTADGAYNPVTLLHAAPTVSTRYTGAARVRPISVSPRAIVVGEALEQTGQYVATLAYDATGFEVDDMLKVTVSNDAGIVGQAFRIVEIQLGSWALGRRLILEKRQPA